MMNPDLLTVLVGAVCFAVGGIVGVASTYGWLLYNSNGVDDEDFVV